MDSKMTAAEQHRLMMAELALPEDTVRFVDSVEDPMICEGIYLCALDGMPLEYLKKLSRIPDHNLARKGDHIRAERKKYLQSVFQHPEAAASKSVEAMFLQVREMYEESKGLRALADESMKKSQKEQNKAAREKEAAQAALLQEKQNMIDSQERYIRQLEKEICESKKQKQETAGKPEKLMLKHMLAETKPGRWLRQKKRTGDSRKFVSLYLREDTYSEEQKEYLLQCFVEGTSLKDMEKFASPDVSVSLMERLRKANV